MVGAARNRDVASTLQPLEVTISAGRCPGVAVAGLTLGGGFGFSARQLGLTADALVETELVTADGKVLTCNATENPDLFWACRGGGGGNFGINTSFTFRTTPVGDVSVYRCTWKSVDAAALLDTFQRVLAGAPDGFSMRLGFGAATRPQDPVSLEAIGQYFGPSTQLADLLAPVFAIAPPTTREVRDVTYWEGKDLLADNEGPSTFTERSLFAPQPIESGGLAALARMLHEVPSTTGPSSASLKVFSWGGAINRVAPTATAFVHRDALALALDRRDVGLGRGAQRRAATPRLDQSVLGDRAPVHLDRVLPELHRPSADRLGARVLRRQPAAPRRGQARDRPARPLPVPPEPPYASLGVGSCDHDLVAQSDHVLLERCSPAESGHDPCRTGGRPE